MTKGGRKRRSVRGGGSRPALSPTSVQMGGKMTDLNPASLNDSFDKSANQLANAGYQLYLKQNLDLASLKGVNVMKGGRRRRSQGMGKRKGRGRGRTAKKYSRKSKSRSRSRSRSRTHRGGGGDHQIIPVYS
jgi:hypothetical protein